MDIDNENKYKGALERAKNIYGASESKDILITLETIFPELKKSQDERIRKELTEFLKKASGGFLDTTTHCKTFGKWLAWLEKQGQSKKISIWKHWKDGIAGNGDGIPVFLIKNGFTYSLSSCLGFECDYIELSELDNLMLEKQEQSFAKTCKVEPKFKAKDWITNGQLTCKVLSATSKSYELHLYNDDYCHFETDIQSVDKDYHLWSIKDAKDGDVLSNGKMIVIFKHFEEPSYRQHIVAYIGLDTIGNIQITDGTWDLGIDKTKPATKEEQDLLFSKMSKAGWSWNATTKELIQSKEVISE